MHIASLFYVVDYLSSTFVGNVPAVELVKVNEYARLLSNVVSLWVCSVCQEPIYILACKLVPSLSDPNTVFGHIVTFNV